MNYSLAAHSGLKVPLTGSSAFLTRSGRQKVSEAAAEDPAATARIRYQGYPRPGAGAVRPVSGRPDAGHRRSGAGLPVGDAWGVFARYNRWDNADSKFRQVDVGFNYWLTQQVVLKLDYMDKNGPTSSLDDHGVNAGVGFSF